MRSMIRIKRTFNLILTLALMLTMAQTAWAQEAAVYDLVTEVPTVDGGQSTNSGSNNKPKSFRGQKAKAVSSEA